MSTLENFRTGGYRVNVRWRFRINWPRFWTGFIWGLYETAYFGWNLTPHSDAELLCDGLGFLMLVLSFESVHNG